MVSYFTSNLGCSNILFIVQCGSRFTPNEREGWNSNEIETEEEIDCAYFFEKNFASKKGFSYDISIFAILLF